MEEILQFEEWRPVVGYEGYYEVSSFGRVRSVERLVERSSHKMKLKSYILVQRQQPNGYLKVSLCKDAKHKSFWVHRLVAQAFIPNPHNLSCINHKTECKTFNHFSALEWCDREYNNVYGTVVERRAEKQSRKVIQYTLNGEFIKEWPSAMEIERQLGFDNTQIGNCCKHKPKYHTAHGFKWEYAENNEQIA